MTDPQYFEPTGDPIGWDHPSIPGLAPGEVVPPQPFYPEEMACGRCGERYADHTTVSSMDFAPKCRKGPA